MLMGRAVKLVFDLRPKALLSSSCCQADDVYSRSKTDQALHSQTDDVAHKAEDR